jgi:lysophospholipase L1-like esterase
MMGVMKIIWGTGLLLLGLFPTIGAASQERAPLAICCAGDSLMRPMPWYFRQLLPAESPDFIIYEWAQGGLSTSTYQGFYGQRAERWRRVKPDFILLQLGTNDVGPLLEGRLALEDFKANLAAIIREFKTYRTFRGDSPRILVATVPLFADNSANQEKNRLVKTAVNPAIREVVERAEACLADNFSILEGRPELYDPDGVHPNSLGGAALAKNWIQSLKACRKQEKS